MITKQQIEDQKYDYQKSVDGLKDMIMYMNIERNTSEIISLQVEINKEFGNILEQRISLEKSFDKYKKLTTNVEVNNYEIKKSY